MNIPIELVYHKVLVFGIGGGFDIFSAIPIISGCTSVEFVACNFNASMRDRVDLFLGDSSPEMAFSVKFPDIRTYTIPKTGVKNVQKIISEIVVKHEIEAVILVDGGVDSLMHGDEQDAGTILEDFISMAACKHLNLPKTLVCCGFGTELEEPVCHDLVLENMANLAASGGFLGSCSLIKQDPVYKIYKDACEFAWSNSRKSHIHTKIISAVEGHFGDVNLYEGIKSNLLHNNTIRSYISPLMNIFWFFDLEKVLAKNLIIDKIRDTNTYTDVLMVYRTLIDELKPLRLRRTVPY